MNIEKIYQIFPRWQRSLFVLGSEGELRDLYQHRGKTSAHAPNYENMAGNLNINF
jgi:hypothetical protein